MQESQPKTESLREWILIPYCVLAALNFYLSLQLVSAGRAEVSDWLFRFFIGFGVHVLLYIALTVVSIRGGSHWRNRLVDLVILFAGISPVLRGFTPW